MSAKDTAAVSTRPVQPRCIRPVGDRLCNHPLSFHGKNKGRCRALGCPCTKWAQPGKE